MLRCDKSSVRDNPVRLLRHSLQASNCALRDGASSCDQLVRHTVAVLFD
jgi:hypothetical protein